MSIFKTIFYKKKKLFSILLDMSQISLTKGLAINYNIDCFWLSRKFITDLRIPILVVITLLFTIPLFMTCFADSLQIHLNLRANHRLNQYNKTGYKFSRGEEIHKVRLVGRSLKPFSTVPQFQLSRGTVYVLATHVVERD